MQSMHRSRYAPGLKLRARGDGSRYVEGYVVRYDDVYELDGLRERIAPGAFHWDGRIDLNLMHEHARVVGAYPNTVELNDTDVGLEISARVLDTTEGRDLVTYVENGVLIGFSSEFYPESTARDGNDVIVERAELFGVGLVSNPAYPKSTASIRDIYGTIDEQRVYNDMLARYNA